MADEQVTVTEGTDKPTNPIREHLFAATRHVDNLEFAPAMKSLLMLQEARGAAIEPKHMMALINAALDDLSVKAFCPLRDYLSLLLRKEESVPPEKLLDLLGIVGMGEERVQATSEFVIEAANFIGNVFSDLIEEAEAEV